ncbi:hypothetical protein DL765_002863 [Monosporascus sp. GIB2]|nr:hypothetical protein DL765_002863 [Monosporascus sp. GIB2]
MTMVSRLGWVYSASLGDGESPRQGRRSNSEESKWEQEVEEEEEPKETLIGSGNDLEDEDPDGVANEDSGVEETDNGEGGFEIPLSAVGIFTESFVN